MTETISKSRKIIHRGSSQLILANGVTASVLRKSKARSTVASWGLDIEGLVRFVVQCNDQNHKSLVGYDSYRVYDADSREMIIQYRMGFFRNRVIHAGQVYQSSRLLSMHSFPGLHLRIEGGALRSETVAVYSSLHCSDVVALAVLCAVVANSYDGAFQ